MASKKTCTSPDVRVIDGHKCPQVWWPFFGQPIFLQSPFWQGLVESDASRRCAAGSPDRRRLVAAEEGATLGFATAVERSWEGARCVSFGCECQPFVTWDLYSMHDHVLRLMLNCHSFRDPFANTRAMKAFVLRVWEKVTTSWHIVCYSDSIQWSY